MKFKFLQSFRKIIFNGDIVLPRPYTFSSCRPPCVNRYSHRRQYLESICRDVGFRVLVANNVVLRKNAGVPVNGFVFVTEVVAVAESDSVDEQ